jgi:hypothetical protein
MCRVAGSGTPIVVMRTREVNCVCYRIVTRRVLPTLLMRFSGRQGLIRGCFVRQKPAWNESTVARGFIPVGLRSGPETSACDFSDATRFPVSRLLCSRTGINPLATRAIQGIYVRAGGGVRGRRTGRLRAGRPVCGHRPDADAGGPVRPADTGRTRAPAYGSAGL